MIFLLSIGGILLFDKTTRLFQDWAEISSVYTSKFWVAPTKQWTKMEKKITFCLFMQECAIVLSLVEPLKASSNAFSLEN